MKLLILCPQWGQENLPPEDFLSRVKEAGYDGVDTWVPDDPAERKHFIGLLKKENLFLVAHQHQATGDSIKDYCRSLELYLKNCMECNPLLINSHSGRDYFPIEDQLRVIDTIGEFSVKNNIQIAHETHRGRIGYSPYNAWELFNQRPGMKITADFSHWTCVTESFLEHSPHIMEEAIKRSIHIHARVGFTEGPQIPDPRLTEWKNVVNQFFIWWDKIITARSSEESEFITITPEFGPPPYMWQIQNTPVANQWDINVYMKNLLLERYNPGKVSL